MKQVIKRVVCKDADMSEVSEWCSRILGKEGWGISVQLENIGSVQSIKIDPVIILYNTLERPIAQIELMIALRWS